MILNNLTFQNMDLLSTFCEIYIQYYHYVVSNYIMYNEIIY